MTVSGPGTRRDITVADDGAYSATLAPGQYAIVGHSPNYNNGQGTCRPIEDEATVVTSSASNVDVICQIK